MPDVSVIIPAFNASKYIADAVVSATLQENCSLEVIVVDDCSTDSTANIVSKIAGEDNRVRLLRLPENVGPAGARNVGIAIAQGEWLALLDADDQFINGRLATLIALGRSQDADVVADNLLLVEETSGACALMMPVTLLSEPRQLGLPEFIHRNISSPDAPRTNLGFLKPIIRRSFIAQHGLSYDECVRFAEDFSLYVDCLRAGARWWLHPRPMYRYLVRENSLTQVQTTSDLARLRNRQRLLLRDAVSAGDYEFARLIKKHLRVVDRCYYYRGFTDEIKAKRLGAAMRYLLDRSDSAWLVTQEAVHQLPTIVRKALKGGYRKS
jgi:glycosyltransferase involved in cell wall biosynthesis